ncbi:hypothetical protein [Paraburkholderia jirisanensis]
MNSRDTCVLRPLARITGLLKLSLLIGLRTVPYACLKHLPQCAQARAQAVCRVNAVPRAARRVLRL